jgi:hypothetical protein
MIGFFLGKKATGNYHKIRAKPIEIIDEFAE